MKNAILQTKHIISQAYIKGYSQNIEIPNYQKFYGFTNERINDYLNFAEIKANQKALTVLASGDQAFNLISKGIKDIDTFDINKLTEYYVFGLKMSLISKYNYYEFLVIYSKLLNKNSSREEVSSIIYDALPYMDKAYRIYWQKILDIYTALDKDSHHSRNLFEILMMCPIDMKKMPIYNSYLSNEETYNLFKQNLLKSNITFTHCNAINLSEHFNKEYNYLLLSNILDYIHNYWELGWDKEKLNIYIESLKPILANNSTIFLHYSFKSWLCFVVGSNLKKRDFGKDEIIKLANHSLILKKLNKTIFN